MDVRDPSVIELESQIRQHEVDKEFVMIEKSDVRGEE
jgi:hypothetical protein